MTSFHPAPKQVLKYLARYAHRVAISNSRLLDVADGTVTFGYKDYAANSVSKVMRLTRRALLPDRTLAATPRPAIDSG